MIFAGSSPNFTCTVVFDDFVDTQMMVIILARFDGKLISSTADVHMESFSHYTDNFVIDTVEASDSGKEYQCSARVFGAPPFILEQEEQSIDSGNIIICKLYHLYYCNKVTTCTYLIDGIPSQPDNLTAVPGSTSIHISWISIEEVVIHNYILQYSYSIRECESTSDVFNVSIDRYKRSHMLDKLEEDSEYSVSLVAINPSGRSEAATIMVTTLTAGICKKM